MKTAKVFFVYLTLLFMQWQNILVESTKTSEAKMTSATQKTDNPYMIVVKDQDAISGWGIEIKKDINETESYDKLVIYFFARTNSKAKFYDTFGPTSLCAFLKNRKISKKFLLKQMTDMVFPKQRGSCFFKKREVAISANRQVNTNFDDKNFLSDLPKTTPYEMEVRVANHEQSDNSDGGEYLFKVNFNIGGELNKN